MAKVLYVVPDGNDLGGIITSSENLMQGFREAGHDASFMLLRHGQRSGESKPRGQHAHEYKLSDHTKMWTHTVHGWHGGYCTTMQPDEFLKYANEYDVVIWGAMYGLRNKATERTTDWARCITELTPPQVFMVRDDHLEKRVPWVMALAPYAAGLAGVQQCSFDSCEGLGTPRALIYSGHGPAHPKALTSKRMKSALAIATWKPWKRGRQLLDAIPNLNNCVTVAGDGIEFRYMRSKDKARPKDFNDKGERIWDKAMNGGMTYMGCVDENVRDGLMLNHTWLIDLSLRINSGQINRAVVEAMRHGLVPIADPRFIGREFEPWVNYLPIQADLPRASLARELNALMGSTTTLKRIRENNISIVDQFSRKTAAAQLVALAQGKKAGAKWAKATIDSPKMERGVTAFYEIFGDLP